MSICRARQASTPWEALRMTHTWAVIYGHNYQLGGVTAAFVIAPLVETACVHPLQKNKAKNDRRLYA